MMAGLTLPSNACSARYVHPGVPWVPSPKLQPEVEFNPYEDALNPVNPRTDGPVVPVPWVEVSSGSTSRGSSPFHGQQSIPRDPFAKRKRWRSLKKVKSFLGIRHGRSRKEDQNWILLPNSLTRFPVVPPIEAMPQVSMDVPLTAWKAYGYWARPVIEGIEVRNNATPAPDHVLQSLNPEDVFISLRGARNSPHPENWVPGLQHPSLPPKPPYWSQPVPHEQMPLPWECQLNPFLAHKGTGLPLLHFDMRVDENSILFASTDTRWRPVLSSNLNQPATYPFVTEMYITAVGDDPYAEFPWPLAVYNPKGVLCKDVFHAVFQNFQRFLKREEVDKFTKFKTKLVEEAFNQRREGGLMGRVWDDQDGLRRIDYFADKVMFRGLEPSPNRGGSWTMFLGPPGPEEEMESDSPQSPFPNFGPRL